MASAKQESGGGASRQWSSAFRNPRIVRVSRSFGGKDRHSKVCTVRGLRDRRIRLSVPTALQLYELQDMLGLAQPSKVIDWLMEATKADIDSLPPLHFPPSFLNPHFLRGHFGHSPHHSPAAASATTHRLFPLGTFPSAATTSQSYDLPPPPPPPLSSSSCFGGLFDATNVTTPLFGPNNATLVESNNINSHILHHHLFNSSSTAPPSLIHLPPSIFPSLQPVLRPFSSAALLGSKHLLEPSYAAATNNGRRCTRP